MFKAIVLICHFAQPVCLEAHDEWGPYTTREKCKVRIEEMITDLKTVKNGFLPAGSKCINELGEGV